jgi:putative hydrolase of the HAD superfamily
MRWLAALMICMLNFTLATGHTVNNVQVERKHVKAIIFDIGNVLIQVDLSLWEKSFREIGVELPKNVFANQEFYQLVHAHGIGKISTPQLIQQFAQKTNKNTLTVDQFKHAWNAVILSFYPESLNTLALLRTQGYQIYALSDTNEIHITYLQEQYKKLYPHKNFLALFDKSYLSHITGYGKNQDEAWIRILKEHHLKPTECLFIDDLSSNIERAKQLGLHTFHYTPQSDMQMVLKHLAYLNKSSS